LAFETPQCCIQPRCNTHTTPPSTTLLHLQATGAKRRDTCYSGRSARSAQTLRGSLARWRRCGRMRATYTRPTASTWTMWVLPPCLALRGLQPGWPRARCLRQPLVFLHPLSGPCTPCWLAHPQVMKAVLRLACEWGVSVDSGYATLAIAVCVLVGFATSLDPAVNLMDAATPCLLAHTLTGRVVGRLYS
jgi:hypothetical protein